MFSKLKKIKFDLPKASIAPLYSPGGNTYAMNIIFKGPNEKINFNFVSWTPVGSQRWPLFTIAALGLILKISMLM